MPGNLKQSHHAAALISSMLLSLPVVAIVWGAFIYMVTGLTGRTVHPYFHTVSCSVLYLIIFGWAFYGSMKTSETVYRLCRFGAILSLLLPVSAGVTSLMWFLNVTPRPADFFPGYSAFELPAFAAGIALVLILLFFSGSYLAARDMEGVPF